jgi:hypothetical protein
MSGKVGTGFPSDIASKQELRTLSGGDALAHDGAAERRHPVKKE